MKSLDIGEVSERSGVAASALRYYEEVGLIRSTGRHGLRRQYDAEVLEQLAVIALGKAAGFSLDEIAGMFGRDGSPDLPRPILHRKADQLDRQIRSLAALSNMLRHVADCPADNHMRCPKFRKLLRLATRNRQQAAGTGGHPRG